MHMKSLIQEKKRRETLETNVGQMKESMAYGKYVSFCRKHGLVPDEGLYDLIKNGKIELTELIPKEDLEGIKLFKQKLED